MQNYATREEICFLACVNRSFLISRYEREIIVNLRKEIRLIPYRYVTCKSIDNKRSSDLVLDSRSITRRAVFSGREFTTFYREKSILSTMLKHFLLIGQKKIIE